MKGIGSSLTSGFRWNSKNTSIVYTSESRALATLVVAVHLDLAEDFPTDRYYVEIEIPDDLLILELSKDDLPKNWDKRPPLLETQYIGDDFVRGNEAAVLKVPSSIVPLESNYLINPHHKDSKRIKVVAKSILKFDKGLKGS